MIKKYKQFVNNRLNEDLDEIEKNIILDDETHDGEGDFIEEEEEEGDIYYRKLKELADALGSKVEDGKVRYEGKEIIFPSETEMYHVDRKKFETIEEVLNYLKN